MIRDLFQAISDIPSREDSLYPRNFAIVSYEEDGTMSVIAGLPSSDANSLFDLLRSFSTVVSCEQWCKKTSDQPPEIIGHFNRPSLPKSEWFDSSVNHPYIPAI